MRNPLATSTRRDPNKPSLRDRIASLGTRLSRLTSRGRPDPDDEIEEIAALPFEAHDLNVAVRTPVEWSHEFAQQAMAMHIADRTLRMGKAELVAFIQNAGERHASTPEAMFRALGIAHENFDGWASVLSHARDRYLVAACAADSAPDPTV